LHRKKSSLKGNPYDIRIGKTATGTRVVDPESRSSGKKKK
jgi:hypothetical protein